MPSPSFWTTYIAVAITIILMYVTGLAAWFAEVAAPALTAAMSFANMVWGEHKALILGFVAFQCVLFAGVTLYRSRRW